MIKNTMDSDDTKRYGLGKDNWVDCFYVDTYIDAGLNERVGFFNDKRGNRIDIYIKESNGNEPHIHLRDHCGNVCRIKLRKNEYQRDAYEKNKRIRLSDDDEEAFNKYMHAIVKDGHTNWYLLSNAWNTKWKDSNPGKSSGIVDTSKGCPDYTDIKEPK